jgi:serine/threonine-protein kinase
LNQEEQNIDNDNQQTIHKPYSKFRDKNDDGFKLKLNFDPKTSLPYVVIVLIFILTMFFVFLVFDGIIMPSIVHNKSLVKVPDLTGKALDVGIREVVNKSLNYKVVQEIYSEEFPSQTIVKQVPSPNLSVKEGRTIYITLSKGKEMVTVPNLVGLPIGKVRVELMKIGLELGEIDYDNSEFIAKDTIMAQNIRGGQKVPYGSSVNIVISLGSDAQISVPSFIGLRYDEVLDIITNSGFILGEITYQQSETFTPNTIIGQTPEAGEIANKSSVINIIISK